ncbi:MAG TPA: tetratricopeptide repeat protein [Chthoniobacterales bacterium]|nr:tetratricopeptide repeat protein [Chthoniobacterales bacterium]
MTDPAHDEALPERGPEHETAVASHQRDVAPASDERPLWQRLLLAILLLAATIAAYQHAWHAGFIWDDDIYVTGNPLLTAADGLKRIWFSLDSPSQYFPLVYTTFRFEHALWGLNPVGYHWVNFALHAANALLVWRLLSLLRVPGAWLAAGLFALHPVQVESVAWITERKNLLMGFFFLLALIAWVKFVAGKHRGEVKFYLLALLCYALALSAKTTACTLPAALILISWLKRGAIPRARLLQILPFVLLGIGMGIVTIWWERFHQGTQGELFAMGIPERILIAAHAFWFYLWKLVWPVNLAFSYPRWTVSLNHWPDYIWAGGCVLLAAIILIGRRFFGRSVEVAFVFFVATLSPMLGFVMLYTFRYSFVADHYQYLASIGPLALGAAAIATALRPLGRFQHVLLPLISAALLGALGFLTWRQVGAYANEEALWRATLAVNPASWMAHNNLGIQLLHSDRGDEAIAHFEEALRLDPNYAEGHYNLANALLRLGRGDEAAAHYERALELIPRYAAAHANFGALLLRTGQIDAALEHLAEAVKIEPSVPVRRLRLGEAFLQLGRTEEANAQFDAALAPDPNSVEIHYQIALAFLHAGLTREAVEHLERVVAINPNNAAAHNNFGNILTEIGRKEEALVQLDQAIALDPGNAETHYNLANALLQNHRVDEAIGHYERALEIKPDYPGARNNLGNALGEQGRFEEAIAQYEKALETKPDYANAHENLASALNRVGRFDEGMEHLQIAWKLRAQSKKAGPVPAE